MVRIIRANNPSTVRDHPCSCFFTGDAFSLDVRPLFIIRLRFDAKFYTLTAFIRANSLSTGQPALFGIIPAVTSSLDSPLLIRANSLSSGCTVRDHPCSYFPTGLALTQLFGIILQLLLLWKHALTITDTVRAVHHFITFIFSVVIRLWLVPLGIKLIPGGRYMHSAWLRTMSDTISSLGTDPWTPAVSLCP